MSNRLIDGIKNEIDDTKDETTIANVKKTIELLSGRLLQQASEGTIDLDIKDLKDLTSVLAMLKDSGEDNGQMGTPPVSGRMTVYFNSALNGQKDNPEQADDETDISQGLEDMSDEDVNKMLNAQFEEQNKENFDKNNEA